MADHSNRTSSAITIDGKVNGSDPRTSQPQASPARNINVTLAQAAQAGGADSKDLWKTNATLIVWLVFLCLGGSLLVLYYAHIGYLPEIEWKSALIYLGIASIIGGAVGVLLSLSLLIPGLIWDVFLVCDPTLTGIFCYQEGNRRDPSVYEIARRLGLPFGVVLAICHVALPFPIWVYIVVAFVLLGATSIWMYRKFCKMVKMQRGGANATGSTATCFVDVNKSNGKASTSQNEIDRSSEDINKSNGQPLTSENEIDKSGKAIDPNDDHHRLLRYTFWFALSVFVGQFALLMTYQFSGRPGWDRGEFWIAAGICTFMVLLSNHVVAFLYANHRREAVLASVVSAILLLVVANGHSSLPAGIMSLYGFGNNQTFTLFVNAEGKSLLGRMGLSNQPCPDNVSAEDKLCSVEILSELGTSYYLRRQNATLTLPKQMVVARKAEPKPEGSDR